MAASGAGYTRQMGLALAPPSSCHAGLNKSEARNALARTNPRPKILQYTPAIVLAKARRKRVDIDVFLDQKDRPPLSFLQQAPDIFTQDPQTE